MPRGDGTGPMGMGPMSGRAAGYCAGYPVPGYMNPVSGRGYGMGWGRGYGRGFGRGWGRGRGLGWPGPAPAYTYPYEMPAPPINPQQQRDFLQNQANDLQAQLDYIKQQLEELDSAEPTKK